MRWNRRDMASMNNSLAYIRYHLWRDRNFLILYGTVLLTLFPLLAFGLRSAIKLRQCTVVLLWMLLALMIVMALLLPIYLFDFLWDRRKMDLYACVGIKRKSLYACKYGIGMLYLWCPPFAAMLLTVFVLQNGSLFLEFSSTMGQIFLLALLLYSLNVWIAITCRSTLDAIVMVIGYFIVPFLLIFALWLLMYQNAQEFVYCYTYDLLYEGLLANPLIRWLVAIVSVPSACVLLANEMTAQMVVEGGVQQVQLLPVGAWVIWAALCVVLFFGAKRSFIAKRAEDAQTRTTAILLYPTLIAMLTLSLLLLSQSWRGQDWTPFSFLNPPLIAALFLFFVLGFVARRKICIRPRQIGVLCLLFAAVLVLKQSFLMSQGFGLINERISEQADQIQVEVSINSMSGDYYHVSTVTAKQAENEEAVEMMRGLQETVIEDAKTQGAYWYENTDITIDISFRFMQNGTYCTRGYTLMANSGDERHQRYLDVLAQMQEEKLIVQEYKEGTTESESVVK